MQSSDAHDIRLIDDTLLGAVLDLNTVHATELSLLDSARLKRLVDAAYFAPAVGRLHAFMLVFDETSDYDSPNFLWFRERYPRFAYVDRIAVAEWARGQGLARLLYEALFDKARSDDHGLVTCEVNLDPPNPSSDAFHAAMGFREVGTGGYGAKTVRYFVKDI